MKPLARLAPALLATALLVAGCGSGGDVGGVGAVVRAGASQVVGGLRPGRATAPAPAAQPRALTRADFEAAGRPVLRLRLLGRPRGTLFTAATQNADVTGYVTPLREYVGMRGAQIVATRALGNDLLRSTSSPGDPLVRPVPLADWPAEIVRTYELPEPGPAGTTLTYACRFAFGPAATQSILGLALDGVEVTETCAGPAGTFQNLHFAEAATGRVWRSIQWTGPRQGLVDIEIIVPGP